MRIMIGDILGMSFIGMVKLYEDVLRFYMCTFTSEKRKHMRKGRKIIIAFISAPWLLQLYGEICRR